MGKTRKLAEDQQEKESADAKNNLEPSNPNATRKIKMKGLTDEVYTQLVNYLETRTYGEVKGLLASLSQAPVLDVEFKNN